MEFLKKWIASEDENKMDKDAVEKEFANIEKSIKWDLISAKFALEHTVKVEMEEIKMSIKPSISNISCNLGTILQRIS